MTRISSSSPTVKAETTPPRLLVKTDAAHAQPAPTLAVEVVKLGAFAITSTRHHKDTGLVACDIGGDDLVTGPHGHAPHTGRVPAHGPDVGLREPDRQPCSAHHENVVLPGRDDDRNQLVTFAQVEGDQAVAPAPVVLGEGGLLHLPLLGGEDQVPVRVELPCVDQGLDALPGARGSRLTMAVPRAVRSCNGTS